MAERKLNTMEIVALILMLIPVLSIVGVILYILYCGKSRGIKLLLLILSIPFGLLASIWLWLEAFGVIKLGK